MTTRPSCHRLQVAALAIAVAATLASSPARSDRAALGSRDLADLTLEQLSEIVVTSVSRREEPLGTAAASVYVISAADIRASGATTLPEALRLAPNLHVARALAGQYAISARGFNSTIANRMLVLIDGRTVYSPLFSGVFWDIQDVMLEDVAQIEVISGPGGTLWGANAVNGVINVITRRAAETQGTGAAAGFGPRERMLAARHGGQLGAGHYRIYAMTGQRDAALGAGGNRLGDAVRHSQVGFRADWGRPVDGFTLQGDTYRTDVDPIPQRREMRGANLLGRWNRTLAGGSQLRLQAYYDHTEREHFATFIERLSTFDVELQQALPAWRDHRIVWGGGYRLARDRIENFPTQAFLPPDRNLAWWNLFAQDEIALRTDLALVIGAKLEHNDYTGIELLPNLRLAWQPSRGQLLWAAVSRAVRAPSRLDRELFLPGVPPHVVLAGGPNFVSEVSNVLELGYRTQATRTFAYSVTAFHHQHERLRSIEARAAGPQFENWIEGRTNGIEAWGEWQPTRNWRLAGGFALLDQQFRRLPGSAGIGGAAQLGNDPSHWWSLRSTLALTPAHTLDVLLRGVDALPDPPVPSYRSLDAQLRWRLSRELEVSLIGRNLLDRRHAEFGSPAARAFSSAARS